METIAWWTSFRESRVEKGLGGGVQIKLEVRKNGYQVGQIEFGPKRVIVRNHHLKYPIGTWRNDGDKAMDETKSNGWKSGIRNFSVFLLQTAEGMFGNIRRNN